MTRPDSDPLPQQPLVDEREPLSIAEEIAEEVKNDGLEPRDRYEALKRGDTYISSLQRMSMPELIELARKECGGDVTGVKKHELVFRIFKERVKLQQEQEG